MLIAIGAGLVLGFLSGLGTGGGSLLILWLTLVLQFDQPTARIMNLLFFLPPALIACCFRWKQGKLNLGKIWPAIALGCLSAGAFSLLGGRVNLDTLQKLFGFLLLLTGIRELFYRPRKAK